VKRTLLIPVVLLLNTALFGVLSAIPVILVHSSTVAALHHLGPIVLAATMAAVLFTVVRSVFRDIMPPLFLFLIAVTVVTIVTGVLVVDETVLSHRLGDPAVRNPLPTEVILYGPDYSVRIGESTGAALEDVLLFRRHEFPVIVHIPEAVWNEQTMEIVPLGSVAGTEEIRLSAQELSSVAWRHLPPSVDAVARQIVSLYTVLQSTFRARLMDSFLAYAIGLLCALIGVWTPARLFRWPLLNLLVSIMYLRLVVAVPALVVRFSVGALLPDFLPAFVGANLTPLVWGTLGIVLLVVAAFLPSLKRWRREIAGSGGSL
jgi:hypothetical protein